MRIIIRIKGSDGGSSWRWIDFLHTYPGEAKYHAADILVDRRNPHCVLFGFQHVIGDGILARTTDGGYTWSELGESTSALAVDPNNPDLVCRGRSLMGGVWAITNPLKDSMQVQQEGCGARTSRVIMSGDEPTQPYSCFCWIRGGPIRAFPAPPINRVEV